MSSISDGKEKAKSCDAKNVETSCVLKHNVDELLVGVTKQVLLRKEDSSIGENSRNGTQPRVKSLSLSIFSASFMYTNVVSMSKKKLFDI